MSTDTRPRALIVAGATRDYVIEPLRFLTGLSRVQMVDKQLARLAGSKARSQADVDALLDARARYAQEDEAASS